MSYRRAREQPEPVYPGRQTPPVWAPFAVIRSRFAPVTDAAPSFGVELVELHAFMTEVWPAFADYQKRTDRIIRVVVLSPLAD